MSRVMLRRLVKLEQHIEDGKPPAPGIVLLPGQEPPEGFTGPVIRIQVVDGRRPVTA